jgi:hypothetical protein
MNSFYIPKAKLIHNWAGTASLTGTGSDSESLLKRLRIPANVLKHNGVLEIDAYYSHTDSANDKTVFIRANALAGSLMATFLSTTGAGLRHLGAVMLNRNSQAVNLFGARGAAGAAAGAAVVTGTLNTAADFAVWFNGQLETTTETLVLQAAFIKAWNS